jgi:hypothetical protein
MTERTVSTGGGQCDSEADGPADCEVIFSILCFIYAKVGADNTQLQQQR